MARIQTTIAAVLSDPATHGRGAPCEVREIHLPDLEPRSALLRVELSEVCGTDMHLRDDERHGPPSADRGIRRNTLEVAPRPCFARPFHPVRSSDEIRFAATIVRWRMEAPYFDVF